MKKRTTKLWRVAAEMICLLLIFSMMVGIVPMTASEAAAEGSKPETVTVAKLTKDAPRGTVITEEYVELVTLKNVNVPANVISDPEEIYAKYAKRDLYAGEFISNDQLSSSPVRSVNPDLLVKPITENKDDYVVVTDYVVPNTGEDLSVYLQDLIDKNPKRTIYFPDGVYTIARPLTTSAAGKGSTSIQLSDGATIKAAKGTEWKDVGGDALICLGASAPANDIVSVGSYYTVIGGTLDGNGVTSGISIDSGRETVVRNICIKNAKVGISVKDGANGKSSDCDFEDITIIGQGKSGSVGVEVIGYDNTFSNIRIYNMKTGMHVTSGGNLIKNIYIFNDEDAFLGKSTTVGIYSKENSRINLCHTVNCSVGFQFGAGSAVWDCTSTWTTSKITTQHMFTFTGNNLVTSACKAYFCPGEGVDAKFVEGSKCDIQFIEGCYFDTSAVSADSYQKFIADGNSIIPVSK